MYAKTISNGLFFSAFIFFALSLCVPSGYSYGAVGLLLFAVLGLRQVRGAALSAGTVALMLGMLLMGVVWGLGFDGWGTWGNTELWAKYWLAAGALWVVAAWGIRTPAVAWGVAAGALGALAIAAYQYLGQGMDKASGYTNAIQYGGIAMYLGLAAWCFALFARQSVAVSAAFWVAGACGVVASLLSETRGAWVVAPMLLACMLWVLFRNGRAKLAVGTLVAVCCLVLAVAVPYADKFGARAHLAVQEFNLYLANPQQAAETSIGQRLEQWRLALRMGEAKPLAGWGVQGVIAGKQTMVDQGLAHPSVMDYGHAHNEILDMWAKRGAVGVALLLLFYAIPLAVFWPTRARIRALPESVQPMAVALRLAAALLPVAYFGFGWTQVFFAHNSGNLFYLFALVAFWGALQHLEGRTRRA